MVDINTFLTMIMYILGSILLIYLIILVVKMIHVVDKLNGVMDEVNDRITKFDRMFHFVDYFTDNMAIVSDKLVDGMSNLIRRIFYRKEKRKEEDINE